MEELNKPINWYMDGNPFRLSGRIYVKLLPAFVIAGTICMAGVLIAAVATAPFVNGQNNWIQEFVGFVFYSGLGGMQTAVVGFFATILISIFDASFGRVLLPRAFAGCCVGLSVIPIAVEGIFQQAFSTYPDSDWYVSITFIGCLAGVLTANLKFPMSGVLPQKFRFSVRQLLALTFWIALVFALGFGNILFLVAAAIFLSVLFTTLFVVSKICPIERVS